MKNMLFRLRELKKKVKKEPKVERREPVEYHGANETIVQEDKEERALKGKPPLPAINPLRGGTSTIARKDKSWKSVPDFFAKLLKKK